MNIILCIYRHIQRLLPGIKCNLSEKEYHKLDSLPCSISVSLTVMKSGNSSTVVKLCISSNLAMVVGSLPVATISLILAGMVSVFKLHNFEPKH